MVEVVALAGALAHAGEHRQARVLLGDVVDEFHHVHGLAHAGAAEQADLAALGERADEINNLDARLEQVLRRREFFVLGRVAVDRGGFLGRNRTGLVDRAAEHVHDATQRLGANGHHDRVLRVDHGHAAAQAVGGSERDGAHDAVTELLLHLERQADFVHLERVVDGGHLVAREFHVDHRTDALNDSSLVHDVVLKDRMR